MISLTIEEIKDYGIYHLVDKRHNSYDIMFQFFGVEKLSKGDKIFLDEKYLDRRWENFAQPYAFTAIEEEVFKAGERADEIDFISIKFSKNNKSIFLKRIYG